MPAVADPTKLVLNHWKLGSRFWVRFGEQPQRPRDPDDDGDVPWWALRAVEPRDETEALALSLRLRGVTLRGRHLDAFRALVSRVHLAVVPLDPAFWVRFEPRLMAHLALSDPRSFVQLCGLTDDQGLPLVLADFQVRGINDMRTHKEVLILWPFEHGKSFHSSITVPLMDWAEEPESTQIRVYYADVFKTKFTRKLMWAIRGGWPRLNLLFPHIRKPMTKAQKNNLARPPACDPAPGEDDPCAGYWSTDAVSIGGKRNPDASWRPLTAASGQTGWRAWRVICDDLVNQRNASSPKVQDYLEEYFNSGVATMPADVIDVVSAYRTRWGTLGVVGTLFNPNDLGCRLYDAWLHDRSRKVRKLDIYPRGPEPPEGQDEPEVLWPARKPYAKVLELRGRLGWLAFDMRCRNIPHRGAANRTFTRADVDRAFVDLPYGTLPASPQFRPLRDGEAMPQNHWLIGFDPAKGKRTKYAKNPAAVLLCVAGDTGYYHIVRWLRMVGLNQLRQTEILLDWARQYRCPIALEANYDVDVYRDHVRDLDPSVRLICHTTGENKRDPEDGVSSLISPFENGAVRIHARGCPPEERQALLDELCHWPNGLYSDLVMALWVAKFNLKEYARGLVQASRQVTPVYVRSRGLNGMIDLRPYRSLQ